MNNWLGFQIEYLLLLQNFREMTHGVFDWFFGHITMFGEYCFAMLIVAFFYWIIDKKCGIFMYWNLFGGILVNQFIKITACIYRPWILDGRIHPVVSAMKKATGYSFPSGHTAIATGTYGALVLSFWKNKIIRYLLITFILLIGFSRNYLGVHTLQDVLVSLILGALILFGTSKVLKWVESGKNRDLIVFGVVLGLGALLLVYTQLKHYPVDYLNGVILVNPEDMRYESFPKAGFVIGAFFGWLLERRFIKFEAPKGSVWTKLWIYLVGAGILCFLQGNLTSLFMMHLSAPFARFTSCLLISLFVTAIYPSVINGYNELNKKKTSC